MGKGSMHCVNTNNGGGGKRKALGDGIEEQRRVRDEKKGEREEEGRVGRKKARGRKKRKEAVDW